jgi:hypothetical protein
MSTVTLHMRKVSPQYAEAEVERPRVVSVPIPLEIKRYWSRLVLLYALERVLGLKHAFYGELAHGSSLLELLARRPQPGTEFALSAAVVTALWPCVRDGEVLSNAEAHLTDLLLAAQCARPAVLTTHCLRDICAWHDESWRVWSALPGGERLALDWPPLKR